MDRLKLCMMTLTRSSVGLLKLFVLLFTAAAALWDGTVFSQQQQQVQSPASVTNAAGIAMVEIPAGSFMMGGAESPESVAAFFTEYGRPPEYFADEYPRHRVSITRPFLLGKHEVTVGQFRQFVQATQFKTEAEQNGSGGWGYDAALGRCIGRDLRFTWQDPGFKQTDQHPVLNVSWNDCQAFCHWLTQKDGREHRLPTEAEWEYACRAGTATRYSCGDLPKSLEVVARSLDPKTMDVKLHVQDLPIPAEGDFPFTAPVGSFAANSFGLYDMHGNVWEWVSDRYGERFYEESATNDPRGPAEGHRRVRRGGAWNSFPLWSRASFRNWNTPSSRCVNLGFRVAAEIAPVAKVNSSTPSVSIVFVGDIMLDNGPGHAIASGRDPFFGCRDLLRSGDFAVGNLECVIGRGGKQLLKPYVFRAAPDSPQVLKRYFSAISLANNHSFDYGVEGFVEAIDILEQHKLNFFGGGRNLEEARRPFVFAHNGIKVAVLGANSFRGQDYAATASSAGSAPLMEENILADIQASRKMADAVVPFVHWGPELSTMPRASQIRLARRMIDAGASAVIGAHPHVTQTVDFYRGAPIIYSLGNFVFDYYPVDPPEWTGWVAKLTFTADGKVDLDTTAIVLDAAGLPTPVILEDALVPPQTIQSTTD